MSGNTVDAVLRVKLKPWTVPKPRWPLCGRTTLTSPPDGVGQGPYVHTRFNSHRLGQAKRPSTNDPDPI